MAYIFFPVWVTFLTCLFSANNVKLIPIKPTAINKLACCTKVLWYYSKLVHQVQLMTPKSTRIPLEKKKQHESMHV